MTTRPSTSHIAPFGLRMQPELRARLEESAQKTGRSLNAEIVARLEESLAPDSLGMVNQQRYVEMKREILQFVLDEIEKMPGPKNKKASD